MMTDEPCEAQIRRSVKGWPSRYPNISLLLRLLDEARSEIARVQAPPSASAMERARKVLAKFHHWLRYAIDESQYRSIVEEYGVAIEQAEAAARARAFEDAAQFHALQPGNPALRLVEADAIRALAGQSPTGS